MKKYILLLLVCYLFFLNVVVFADAALPGVTVSGKVVTATAGYIPKKQSINAFDGTNYVTKSVNGDVYNLALPTNSGDYKVNVTAFMGLKDSEHPSATVYFSPRNYSAASDNIVNADYSTTATVHFRLSVLGDPYTIWQAYGYATTEDNNLTEQTKSISYTEQQYSPQGSWQMPVVANDTVRVYVKVVVDKKPYFFWYKQSDYRYENIKPDETLNIDLEVNHVAAANDTQDSQEDQFAQVTGNVFLDITVDGLNYEDSFLHHQISGYKSQKVDTNPGDFSLVNEKKGTRYYRPKTYFSDNNTLYWPYTGGDSANDKLTIEPGQTYTKKFTANAGLLKGELKFTGTLQDETLNSVFLYGYGANEFYDQNIGWIKQTTYGGSSYIGNGGQNPWHYTMFLTEGPWQPYRITANGSSYQFGDFYGYSVSITDYNYYYDGKYYDFGAPVTIVKGESTLQDREYCMGSVAVRFNNSGETLFSYPRVNGRGVRLTEENKKELTAEVSAVTGLFRLHAPELIVHGPTAEYVLDDVSAINQDGARIKFKPIAVGMECGVRKGRDISSPDLVVDQPSANIISNKDTFTISGTVSDNDGIGSVKVNGDAVSLTNNQNNNGFAFLYNYHTVNGKNTLHTEAYDKNGNRSYDKRDLYIDRWQPLVRIDAPEEGKLYSPVEPIPVAVEGSDRGYGFDLIVTLDDTTIYRSKGVADDKAPVKLNYNNLLDPTLFGKHVLQAVVNDAAGNSASDAVTFDVYLAANVTAKPESRNNKNNGVMTVFVNLPEDLTRFASLDLGDTMELSSGSSIVPKDVKYSAGDDKLIIKFDRSQQLMNDDLFTLRGKVYYEPNNHEKYYIWQGSDTTKH